MNNSIINVIDDLYKAMIDLVNQQFEQDMKHEQTLSDLRMARLAETRDAHIADIQTKFGYTTKVTPPTS